MSADNGYLLRRNKDDKFLLQMYFASNDYYPSIDEPGAMKYDTLGDAIDAYEGIVASGDPNEYGLSIHVREVTEPELVFVVNEHHDPENDRYLEYIRKGLATDSSHG